MKNIWKELSAVARDENRPILVQAPMEDATDTVFRQMVSRVAPPDLFFTEFTNVDGVFSFGESRVIHRLKHSHHERPIIAQIWGAKPENYYNGAKYVREKGFDGVDINMGCPQKNVISKGLCAALIDNHDGAQKIIEATIEGAGDMSVSVKTRIGVKSISTEDWVSFLLSFNLAALTLHGRTVKELSKVPAHWDEIAKAVKIRDDLGSKACIIGNGDVKNYAEAMQRYNESGVDGVMIGRGLLEDIYAFHPTKTMEDVSLNDRLRLLKDHMELFESTWKDPDAPFHKNMHVLKKYYKIYVRGFESASELRTQLMLQDSFESSLQILEDWINARI